MTDPVEMPPDSDHNTPISAKQMISKYLKEEPNTRPDVNAYKNKIRDQAQQLQILEEYKQLCERRIKEISPDHPIPVEKHHLGKKPSIQKSNQSPQKNKLIQDLRADLNKRCEEINLLQRKITNEGDHSDHFRQTEEQKTQLELSLRAEILANEEQRNYIEILKEALEAKLESLGLCQALEQFCKQKDDKIDVFAQFMLIQAKTEEYDKLVKNTENTHSELQKQLSDYSQEVKKIRNELISYKENYAKVKQQLDTEQKNNIKVENAYNQLSVEKENAYTESDNAIGQLKECQKQLNTVTEQSKTMTAQIRQLEEANKKLSLDYEDACKRHKESNLQLTNEKKEKKNLLETSSKSLAHIVESDATIESLTNQINSMQAQISDTESSNRQLEEKLLEIENIKSTLEKDIKLLSDSSKEAISELTSKLEQSEFSLQEWIKKLNSIQAETSNQNLEMQSLKHKLEEAQKVNQNIKQQLEKEKFYREEADKNAKSAFDKLSSEKELLNAKLESNSKELLFTKSECLEVQKAKSTLELELEASKNEKDKYFKDADSTKRENISLYQENTKLRNQEVQIKRDLIEQQETNETLTNENRDLQSRLEEVSISSDETRKLTENQIIALNNEIAERERLIEKQSSDIEELKTKLIDV